MNDAYPAQHPLNQILAGLFGAAEARPAYGPRRPRGAARQRPGHDRCRMDDADRRRERPHDTGHERGHDRGHDRPHERGHDREHDREHDRGRNWERGRGRGGWPGDWPGADLGWLFGGGPDRGWPGGRGPAWGGPRPGRGHRRPRASRGDVRAAILVLLDEAPRNGYQIIQEIADRSRGLWRPSPGSVYPALSQLEDEGLIAAEADGSGRRFELTAEGRAYVAGHRDELKPPWEAMAGERDRDAEREPKVAEFTELMGQTGLAAVQVLRAGNPAQIDQARRLLEETRRGLYRILADGDPADDDSGNDSADGSAAGGIDDETDAWDGGPDESAEG